VAPAVLRPGRRRLLAPVVVAGAVIAAATVPAGPGAGRPHLPAQTVDQLVGRLEEPAAPGVVGALRWRADTGIPDLVGGGTPSALSLASLVAGSFQAEVWYGPAGERVAVAGPGTESDLYAAGGRVWLYDSSTDTSTLLASAGRRSRLPLLGPQLLVAALLGAIPADTAIWQERPRLVAGRPAYVLDLAPRPGSPAAAGSTVARITVAIDAPSGLALAVDVYAKGRPRPALSLTFTSVRLATPPPATFAFAPPPGATVRRRLALVGVPGVRTAGSRGWTGVVSLRAGPRGLEGDIRAATTVVNGSFGRARLLDTGIVNALFLPGGRIVAGLVTPRVLESAAAS
jgi:outer membrane lipoprotein-sorting protein